METSRNSEDLSLTDATDAAGSPRGGRAVPAALFAAIALLIGTDVASDWRAGASTLHLGLEGVVLLLALAGLGWLWVQVLLSHRRAVRLRAALTSARENVGRWREDANRWRGEAQALLRGLSEAIDGQFAQWGLSSAEREVGLLLLKGLALRDIAQLRGTSERTVRQQALALYRKAGVAGRAELSAFFLEDLLLPRTAVHSGPSSSQ